ncbi:hypothetical protein K1719_007995 [Acacia pycnantha]|nr:hypothetical protein K1719_007995 [Acacia pycnantha]
MSLISVTIFARIHTPLSRSRGQRHMLVLATVEDSISMAALFPTRYSTIGSSFLDLGGTFTDLAMWIFYPFNGPARAKVEFINVSLGKISEHMGD